MYDWANSAFACITLAFIFPIYFADVAAAELPVHMRTASFGYITGIALVCIAIASPIFGAIADFLNIRKKLLILLMLLGATSCLCMYFIHKGDFILASVLFVIGNIGFAGGNVFYESLLPLVAKRGDIDRLSIAGYALGYLGGGVLFALCIVMILNWQYLGLSDRGHAVRISLASVGVWWVAFAIPLIKNIKETKPSQNVHLTLFSATKRSFRQIKNTLIDLPSHREIFLFLLAFWFYMDGVGTIIKMAAIYGREIGISASHLMGAGLTVQFLGMPFTFLFGYIAAKWSSKTGLYITLVVYMIICCFGYFMNAPWHFWLLAIMVSMVQGGCQALSRSIFSNLIPKDRSAEFFAFYSVSSRFAGIIGPLLFGGIAQFTGNSRSSILFLIFFFAIGILILRKLDLSHANT